jgi:hypothetical protein
MDDEQRIEQQEVSDIDADTQDVLGTTNNDYTKINARMDAIEKMQTQMFDMLKSIKSAQSDMVMTGNAVISEGDDSEMADGFVPLEDLDFSIER